MLDKQSTQIESALRFAGYLPHVWFHAFCFRECRGHVTPGICRLLHCQLHGFRIPLVLRRYRRSHMRQVGGRILAGVPSCGILRCHMSCLTSCFVSCQRFIVHVRSCTQVRSCARRLAKFFVPCLMSSLVPSPRFTPCRVAAPCFQVCVLLHEDCGDYQGCNQHFRWH